MTTQISLSLAFLLLLTGFIPAQAQALPPMPSIVVKTPLSVDIQGATRPKDTYIHQIIVTNRTEEKQHFHLVVLHGGRDWNTETLRVETVQDGGITAISRCRQGKTPFCRVDWETTIQPGAKLTLTLKAEIPPQTRVGMAQLSRIITEATLYLEDKPLIEKNYLWEVERPLTTLQI